MIEVTVNYFCAQSVIFICKDYMWFGEHALTSEIAKNAANVSAGTHFTFAGDPKCNCVWLVKEAVSQGYFYQQDALYQR